MTAIILSDCRELSDDQIAGFDTVLCDPPYSRHVHENARSCAAENGGYGAADRDLGFAHLTPALRRWIARAAARVRRWSAIYSDVESSNIWRHSCEAAGAEYVRSVPWIRWSQPQLSGDRFCTGVEMITVYHSRPRGKRDQVLKRKKKKHWSGAGNTTHLDHFVDHKALRGDDKHPTEKPLDQALDLVSWLSDPGEIIFDPTCGRGTFGRAAVLLGRHFVGCEINDEERERAKEGIEYAEQGQWSDRDNERICRWKERVIAAPIPDKDKFPPAYARAQSRLADVERLS